MSGLASMLGLRAPVTFSDAADLLAIAELAGEPDRPERGWLSVPGYQAASEAGRALYDAHRALARAAADASACFTPEVLQHDAQELARRFSGEHQGLGKLSAEYRADKRAVGAFTRDDIARETAYQQLPLAAAWQSSAQALAAAEASFAPLLGRYYARAATDFDRLGRALTHAADAVHRAHGQDLRKAASHIGSDALPNPAITAIAAQARQALSAWQATLAPRPTTAGRPELLNGTIAQAVGWLRAHLAPLHAAGAFTHRVSEVAGRPLTFGQARHLVALREAADAAHERLAAQNAAFHDVCGDLYAGTETDVTALRAALDWARRLRTMITGGTGPLTPAHLKAAESAVPTPRLPAADEAWRQARDALMAAFGPDRRADLVTELDDYDDTADLLTVMFDDTGGRDEWHTYQAARASLAAHGLDVAVDFCVAEHVDPAQVPQVIERALLQEWAEHHIRTDPALAAVRSADRDALVREYQELDRALMDAATGDIIRACNARRPRGDAGESAIIHREAEKKTGHMPVRVLIERARHVCQAIKPCFLMSPLAVSQYLPADLHFDVVIVDEASQVSPAGAIGCIYRGSALILAGDRRQLPPASFSGGAEGNGGDEWPDEPGDTADPESVLDLAQGSGAYRSLALRWHYRSRHEALIAFSNAAFYEGRLVTFPSRNSDGPNVGVELFWDEGTYRRGTSRDNPDEATRVAERVIHHYDTRPGLSLGVVAFSEAQAAAIEAAVSRARQRRPDLDRLFTDDRLRGFFVKNLETVQGDERDVVILSIGYGPDENRQLTMNFGPLSRLGGGAGSTSRSPAPVTAPRSSAASAPVTSPSPSPATGCGSCAATSTMPPAVCPRSAPTPGVTPDRRSSSRSSTSSVPGDTRSPPRSAPPDTASTSASTTPAIPACTRWASNLTATSTTPPGPPATATGSARKCSVTWAGTCTASGVPPGTATARARNAGCRPRSSTQWPHPSTACPAASARPRTRPGPPSRPRRPPSRRYPAGPPRT